MKHVVKILMTQFVTHDVKRFIVEKPQDIDIFPGQAAMVAINKPAWENVERPFTPTSLPEDQVLEFIIKEYREHHGMTEKLHGLVPGDELLIKGVYGAITYKGPGVFIAGGTGITPFIAIFRQLSSVGKLEGNSLIYSSKTRGDIILEAELRHYLGQRCILTLTRESRSGYENRRIDESFLKETVRDFDQHFYVCGPPDFVENIARTLENNGARSNRILFD